MVVYINLNLIVTNEGNRIVIMWLFLISEFY